MRQNEGNTSDIVGKHLHAHRCRFHPLTSRRLPVGMSSSVDAFCTYKRVHAPTVFVWDSALLRKYHALAIFIAVYAWQGRRAFTPVAKGHMV